ncbi:hypothetical protein D3C74_369430 [compost metagenome]
MSTDYPQDTKILKHMMKFFLNPGQFTDQITDAGIGSFLSLLKNLAHSIYQMQEERVRIDIAGSHDSVIKSGGDVHIHGDGVSQSSLYSSGDIYFAKYSSMSSDSTMEAAGTINARSVGGESIGTTLLVAGQQIIAHTIRNASVTVGGYSLEITDPIESIAFTARSLKQEYGGVPSSSSE